MEKPMDDKYKLFIDGKWLDGIEGKTFNTYCPANGELLATCADAGREDVDLAVKAAWKAFEYWRKVDPKERADRLMKIAALIEERINHFALIESMERGAAITEPMVVEIPFAIDCFRYFASAIRTEEGRAVMIDDNTLSIILREPIGVVGQIVPWNFPFNLAVWKLAPALAAGNTIVIKPSSETSLSLLELAKILKQVLPPGVVNVITGKGSTTGNYMLEHDGFRKLAFTGSTDIGYAVAEAAAKKIIPATLELGGKSANIFFPDCNWEKALEGVAFGILANQGQVCCAGSRVFVHKDIYDKFLADCVKMFDGIRVGIPWTDVQMGGLVNKSQVKRVLEYVEIGKQEGARVACGGYQITEGELAKGCYVRPTILAEVNNRMRVAQEEIFGPVVCFIKFKDEAEVIGMANDSEYGLAGAVWTKDINRAIRVARAIETGKMWINCYNELRIHAPFGGYKKSGIGRENHLMVLNDYTQTKNIMISLDDEAIGLYA